jgi:UDP-N-acetylenolpyruvoylglucosamine reductase
LLREFASCFSGADRLWLTEIYGAFETPIPGVDGAALAAAVRSTGQSVEFVPDPDDLPAVLRAAMQPGDLVLVLGAGDITWAAHALVERLRAELPAGAAGWTAALSSQLGPGTVVRVDEPLAKRTTLRVGGSADLYVEPADEADLARVLEFCARNGVPWFLLGRGSNLLVKDRGVRGVVVSLAHPNFSKVEVTGSRLVCGAGARLKAVATEARRAGLAGLEFLEGIPGSVGGALRMNAGAMGSWVFDVVDAVRFMDLRGRVEERAAAAVQVEYRGCPLFRDHIALGAVFRGIPEPREKIEARLQEYNQRRWQSQPAAPSAGCIFKNPPEIPAGRLIDELGLKGTRVGGAVVSDVHANFIVNDGAASAEDVLNLIALIRKRARAMRGIELETEVQIVGD